MENDENFGKIIVMSAKDAYVFSLITGATYLTTRYGFTPQGKSVIFYHRAGIMLLAELGDQDIQGKLAIAAAALDGEVGFKELAIYIL